MEQKENRSVKIGARYAIKLADLQAWHIVSVSCRSCRHHGQIPIERLTARRPGHVRLMDLERKFVCTACGNRQGNQLWIAMMDRG